MQDFEKLGVFYLGREYDIAKRKGPTTCCSTTRRI